MTATELQVLLMERAEVAHAYVTRRIPPRFRAVIDPDDILQEAWVAAFRYLPSFRASSPDAFDRWLSTLLRSKLVSAIRGAGRAKRGGTKRADQDFADRSSSFLDLFSRLAGPERTPSSEEAVRDAVHAVQIAVSGLPQDCQKAIRLRYIEGKSQDEVATVMKRTTGAVNSLLYRSLLKMRERMGWVGQYFSDAD